MLYNISIFLLGVAMRFASLFNEKAKHWVNGRSNIYENIKVDYSKNIYWFHCASLGEYDQAIPLIRKIKNKDSNSFIVVTFFSPSGFLNYKSRKSVEDFVTYIPLDTKSNAKKFVDVLKPKYVFFVKYEFWNNHLQFAKDFGSKIYLVSGLFRLKHRFFKWYGTPFRKTLSLFDYFFLQNIESKNLLHSIGFQNTMVTGDTRFDKVIENKKNVYSDSIVEQFLKSKKAFILGSSWTVDEELMKSFIIEKSTKFPFIIAPHDVSESHINQIIKLFPNQIVRYTTFETDFNSNTHNILLIDCIGKLSNIYQYGLAAYIGGGFTGSLHNTLEPAVFGMPILFGPKHSKFPEAELFKKNGIAFVVENSADVEHQWEIISKNLAQISEKAQKTVSESQGASEKIIQFLNL